MPAIVIDKFDLGLNALSQPLGVNPAFLEVMENVVVSRRNCLAKAQGSQRLTPSPFPGGGEVKSLHSWQKADSGAVKYLLNSGTFLGEIHLGSGIGGPIATRLTSGKSFSYATAGNILYCGNGREMRKYYALTGYRRGDQTWTTLSDKLGQSFEVPQTRHIATVSLLLKRLGAYAYGNVYVQIVGDNSGAPDLTNVIATSQQIPASAISLSAEWVPFTFVETGTHQAGTGASLVGTVDFEARHVQIGDLVRNTTDGSQALVTGFATTSSTNDTLTGVLSGGLENAWDLTDAFTVYVRPLLVKDTKYWIVLRATLANSNIAWAVDATQATYADGNFSVYAGSWTAALTTSAYFEIFVQPDLWGIEAPTQDPPLTITIGKSSIIAAYDTVANCDHDAPVTAQVGGNLSQSFQLEKGGSVGSVELYLKRSATAAAGGMTVRIEGDQAGRPDGTALGTSVPVDTDTGIDTSYGWIAFTFALPVELDAAQRYWIIPEGDTTYQGNYSSVTPACVYWGIDQTLSPPTNPGYEDGFLAEAEGLTTWAPTIENVNLDGFHQGEDGASEVVDWGRDFYAEGVRIGDLIHNGTQSFDDYVSGFGQTHGPNDTLYVSSSWNRGDHYQITLTRPNSIMVAGFHAGANNSASLVVPQVDFTDLCAAGDFVRNETDGSIMTVTGFATTVTANDTVQGTLAGGTDNDWDLEDAYSIIRTAKDALFRVKRVSVWTKGGRKYQVSYKNSVTGHISNPSVESGATGNIAGGDLVSLSGFPDTSDEQVDQLVLWATDDGGDTFFYHSVLELPTDKVWEDEVSDDGLNETMIAPSENDPAPAGDLVRRVRNALLVSRNEESPRYVFYSAGLSQSPVGVREECFPANNHQALPGGMSEQVTAIEEQGGVPIVFSPDQIVSIHGETADDFRVLTTPTGERVGTKSPKGTIPTRYGVFFFSSDKRFNLLGSNIVDISEMVRSRFREVADASLADVLVAYIQHGEVNWALVAFPSGTTTALYIYDLGLHEEHPGMGWMGPRLLEGNVVLKSLHIANDHADQYRILAGDDAGYVWELNPEEVYQDNGTNYAAIAQGHWQDGGASRLVKGFTVAEVITNRLQTPPALKLAFDDDTDWQTVALYRARENTRGAVVKNSGTPTGYRVLSNRSGGNLAQKFVLDDGSFLTHVSLALAREVANFLGIVFGDLTACVRVTLQGDSGGREPDGSALATSSWVALSRLSGAYNLIPFEFETPVELAAGTYWIVLEGNADYLSSYGLAAAKVHWGTLDGYSDGTLAYHGGAAGWIDGVTDGVFMVQASRSMFRWRGLVKRQGVRVKWRTEMALENALTEILGLSLAYEPLYEMESL